MSKTFLFIVLLCAALCPPGVYAQETAVWQTLSIDELFSLAEQHSKSLKPLVIGISEAREGVRVAQSARLPEVNASLTFNYLGDAYLTDRDFGNGMNAPMPHFGNNFFVEASQVVYAGGAISNAIAIARLQQENAELIAAVKRNDIRFLLLGYYLEMFKLRNMMQVYAKNIEQTEQVLKDIQAKSAEGIMLKNDITRYDLLLANLELAQTQTRNSLSILNNYLVVELGLPGNIRIEPDSSLLSDLLPIDSETHWINQAYAHSPLLKQSTVAVQIAERQGKIIRSERLPSVALVAGNHLDGPITIEVPPINKNLNYWYAGVNISYKLSALYQTRHSVNRQKFALQQTTARHDEAREHTELAINADYIRYLEAYELLKTQQKSVELANQNYAIISNRYKNEMALITDMLDASNAQLNAELQLANAHIHIIFNYYKLKHTCGDL